MIWMMLNLSHHLNYQSFGLFTLGDGWWTFPLGPTSRWSPKSSPISSGRTDLHRRIGIDQAKSDQLH
jgi:hypothetical protein